MYQMREGLAEYLDSWGYKKEIELSELTKDDRDCIKEAVKSNASEGIIDWEGVSLCMQFIFKIYPTGWEKVYNELISSEVL